MNKLVTVLRDEKKMIDEFKNELIKKYGKENEDGSFVIEPFVLVSEKNEEDEIISKRVQNVSFLKFSEEYSKLLNEVKDIEHNSFDINDFSKIETTDNYNIFFKLFD
jgi:hypothetical protein